MLPVEKLPEAAEKALAGLKADADLKQRIYAAAAAPAVQRFSPARLVTVSCCLVLAAAFAFAGIHLGNQKQTEAEAPFQAFSSASHTSSSPVFLQNFLNP